MFRRLLSVPAIAGMLVLAVAIAPPAFGQSDADVAELKKRLDLSALAAHGKAKGIEGRLPPSDAATLKRLGVAFGGTGDTAALMQDWQAYLATATPPPSDVDALLSLVLRESYLQASADLSGQAERVRSINQKKAAIRDQLSGPGAAQTQEGLRIQRGASELYMRSTGNDDQLGNLHLQSMMQRQQQMLAMTASIARQMNDVAMAAARKMR